jgi:ribosomal protein S18 acetylase RimI-like enzyme
VRENHHIIGDVIKCEVSFILAVMRIDITPLKMEELPILVNISRITFYDTFFEQNDPENIQQFLESSFTPDLLSQEIALPSNHFFLARAGDEIAGYLKLSTAKCPELDGDVLEVCRIYVLKDKLGLGVGSTLMKFAFSFAKSESKTKLFLGVWEHNKKAIRFYENFGFEKFGEHVFMVGKDAQIDWLMKASL